MSRQQETQFEPARECALEPAIMGLDIQGRFPEVHEKMESVIVDSHRKHLLELQEVVAGRLALLSDSNFKL